MPRYDLIMNSFFLNSLHDKLNQISAAHSREVYKIPNYPPINLYKEGEDDLVLEMALAGFKKSEIKLVKAGNKLSLSAKKEEKSEDSAVYFYKNIAQRNIHNEWLLPEYIEFVKADFVDGILKVHFIKKVPDSQKPHELQIS